MRAEHQQIEITPSVLDRLLDDNPRNSAETHNSLRADLSRLKRSVARDLESLLNTLTFDPEEVIQRYPNARNSMVAFGITDLSSLSLLDPNDRAYLRDKIRIAVEQHEPRLGAVRVSLDAPSGTERLLRFRVEGLLRAHPTRPTVSYSATLQPSSNSCHVKET